MTVVISLPWSTSDSPNFSRHPWRGEETTAGIHRLEVLNKTGALQVLVAINVNDSATKGQIRQPLWLP